METLKGWNQQLMMSLFKKEVTYDAGVTMDATSAALMKGYEVEPEWDDAVVSDKDEVTGQEFGTDQEINTKAVKISYKEPKLKPNTLAGLGALVMGSVVSTQDAALIAYKHKKTPIAVGSALPSIQVELKKGGLQYAYKGVKGNSMKLSAEAGGYLSGDFELIASGTRATSATAFVSAITESWMAIRNCKVWMENGANISIAAALTQHAQNISTGAATDIKARLKSFEVGYNNNLEGQIGFGSDVFQDIDYSRRSIDLKFAMLFKDTTELNLFLNQTPVAIEFDLKGALIAAGGTMYYGTQIIVPRFKIKKAPLPKGGVGDILTCEFDCDVQNDGTNAPLIIETYTAKAAYLAA